MRPTDCPGVVTGVVPAVSWNNVVKSDGSNQTPGSPTEKSSEGVKVKANHEVIISAKEFW
jgi:hypothetical protein